MKNDSNTKANRRYSEIISENSCWVKHQSVIRVCAFILFTIISIATGATTVCLTSPKETNKTCNMTFKRTAKRVITYDSRPQYVAIGDFNRDNYLDLVIVNSAIDNIGIRLGYGNGSFGNQTIHPTGLGSRPYWVAVGDFNNDTLLDIVVANYGINNIGLFLGYGNGSFANQLTFSLGSSRPLSIAIGDFNNDNQLDIVVANDGTFSVTVLLSVGNGSFRIETNYHMGYDSMPRSIATGDFNNDNQLDIVTVNYGTSELVVLLATENGTFLIHKYSTGDRSHPCSAAIGDFNNDNYIDIAIVNSATHNVGVFLGYGDGTFRTMIPYPTDSNSYLQFIVTGDFNDDRKLDMIVADSGKNNVIVFEGYGNGTFSIATTQYTGNYSDPCSIAVGDFDSDNKSDIVVVDYGTNYIRVLTSYAFHTTPNQMTYSTGTGSNPSFIAVGNFNNDTNLDIVVANTDSSNIGVFIGSGNGAFKSQEIFPTIYDDSEPSSLAVGDFNNDNQLDIAVTMLSFSEVNIYLGQGNGNFTYGDIYSVGDYSYPYSIAVGDFNNDTNLDMVTANCYGDNIAVLLGNGNGTFTNAIYYSTEIYSCPMFVVVGDFNSDGLLDLVSANYDSATISIFIGNGNGTFQDSIIISTNNYSASWIVVGDLNNDTHPDIVFTDPNYSTIGILLGYGDGTFANINTYSSDSGGFLWSVTLVTFNKDPIVDIAVVNAEDSSISIFLGYGNGTFAEEMIIPIDDVSYSYCIVTGDFNNDGEVDIAVGNAGTDDISVLLLQYHAAFGNLSLYPQGSGSHPSSVATGDLNNDNQMDIVVANSGNDNVQILIGYQYGTFMNKTTYSTGIDSHPQYVVTADFNKDDQLDIAVANSWNDTLMIILNLDNGTFNTSTRYSTGSNSSPNSIASGDFNKDGWIDVVVANRDSDNVGVFLGFDYPTFISYYKIPYSRGSFPYYVAVGDFNRDSRWDIAIAYRQLNSIDIFLGNGNGTFVHQSSNFVGDSSYPISLVIGDFDNDSQSDIAVANSNSQSISILLGYGDGTFAESASQSTGSSSPVSIGMGDFNNDSIQDLVVANKKGDNVGIFIGYGNGSFAEQISYLMPNGSSPVWVVVGDFNKDNILDLAVANHDGNNIGILLGYGDGTFRNVTIYTTGNRSGPCSIAIGDFNKDNCVDIAVANDIAQNVEILFGDGNGTFSSQVTYSTGSGSLLISIAIEDINNDTILDIVVLDWGSNNGNIDVFYGLNNGTFLVPKIYSSGFNSQPSSVAICDFNNDGRVDFAVSNSKKSNVAIMLQDKSEPFGVQRTFSTGNGSSPYSVAVSDFNNDDQLDIAVANYETNNIGIFLGYGNGSFGKQATYSTGPYSSPMSIAIGDFNDDKQFDIVVANSNTNNIGILLGYGNGTFTIIKTYSTGESSEPSSVAIADLNRDNQMDIVVTNTGINTVLVFFGSGTGTFSNPKSYSFDYDSRPISTAIGDFNNDTWLDIAVANYGLGYVEVLLQTC